VDARRAIVERILDDPPSVHHMDGAGTLGVWSADADCYRFIGEHCHQGQRTLETGVGLSTVVFAALGTHHQCVTLFNDEVDRLTAHCGARSISLDHVQFHVGRSENVLPRLEVEDVDLAFIDGNHGFPVPMLDFLFAGGRLRAGGVLVLDDLQLPSVRLVADFCDLDGRWMRLVRTPKWGAWRRRSSGPLVDDHYDQPFLTDAWAPGGGPFGLQVRRLAAHAARGLRRRLLTRRAR
jgi:hypothetical protein